MIRDILKYSTSKMAVLRLIMNIPATLKMIFSLDIVDDIYRRNMGFEIEEGAFDRVRNDFINDMRNAKSYRDVRCVYNNAKSRMRKIALNKPKHPVRIGVVGEYYTLIDSFSNLEFEKSLAKMGVEVNRCMNISNSLLISPIKGAFNKIKSYLKYDLKAFPTGIWAKFYQKECNDYIKYDTGSSSVYTIASAKRYAKAGFDGLIHAKTFGCMPEIDAIPVLNNISEDYKIPVLFLSFDTQTSETGIETRLEAFVDMINLKRKAAGEADF